MNVFKHKTLSEVVTGIPKEVLEYLESNTNLANTAIESHNTNFRNNVLYIFIGFILSLIPITVNSLTEQKEKELIKGQFDEIDASYDNLQKELYRMRSKYEILEKQIDSLR